MKPMQSDLNWRGYCIAWYSIFGSTFFANADIAVAQVSQSPCDQAAMNAAQTSNVPVDIMLAVTRVETGRSDGNQINPWPWAINLDGNGHWFADADQAIAFADEQLAQGIENFDVGCFQINLRWHGAEFTSLADVFDPQTNADYAARFLSDLYAEKGDWQQAVAAYHSRTPELAAVYVQKITDVIVKLASVPENYGTPVAAPARPNRFPLLQGGMSAGAGSIVPMIDAVTPLIGEVQ